MGCTTTTRHRVIVTTAAWTVGFPLCLPILWTFLTSFKSAATAGQVPPAFLLFDWTRENHVEVNVRSECFRSAINSLVIAVGSVPPRLLAAIPAA